MADRTRRLRQIAHEDYGRSHTKITADRPRMERQIAHEIIGRLPIPWSVLYHRTAAGQILVEAQLNREEAPPGGQAAKRNTAPKE
jgi:hypothetical protein